MDKLPPNSEEAEQAVIGSILINPDSLLDIADTLKQEHFFYGRYGVAYHAALNLLKRGTPATIATLHPECERLSPGYLVSTLLETTESVPTAGFIKHYANQIINMAICREGIVVGEELISQMFSNPSDPEKAIASVVGTLSCLSDKTRHHSSTPDEIIMELYAEVEKLSIPLPWKMLNYLTGGLVPGEMWNIGGFSSTGKTAFALAILMEVLKWGGGGVYFSLEMSRTQLMRRMLCSYRGERWGSWSGFGEAEDFFGRECKDRLWLYDDVYTMDEIEHISRKHKINSKLNIIVVDYLQNMSGSGEEYKVLSDAAIRCLKMAKDNDCTVIALNQLSNAEAKMGDNDAYTFKGSGAIRDTGDKNILLVRNREEQAKLDVGTMTVHLKKNRQGRITGKDEGIPFNFEFATGRFKEAALITVH